MVNPQCKSFVDWHCLLLSLHHCNLPNSALVSEWFGWCRCAWRRSVPCKHESLTFAIVPTIYFLVLCSYVAVAVMTQSGVSVTIRCCTYLAARCFLFRDSLAHDVHVTSCCPRNASCMCNTSCQLCTVHSIHTREFAKAKRRHRVICWPALLLLLFPMQIAAETVLPPPVVHLLLFVVVF